MSSPLATEVFPLNWLECSLLDERESEQQFYRRKFQGSLTFGGKKHCADFTLFYDIEQLDPCEEIYFMIFRDGVLWWEGYFSTSKGEWDLDAQTFTVTPLTIDDYNEWERMGDEEFNLIYNITPQIVNYDDGSDTETYERCLPIGDVIEYLVQQIYPTLTWGVTILSEFLTNATNPITGATNKYNHLFLSQKSDVKRPNSTNPATIGMMSFNQLIHILRCMNLRWEYAGGILTIEHVSNWTSNPGVDIRTQEMAASTNKYKYLKEETPKTEKFTWMEANNLDFIGEPIWYDSYCVNQDAKTNKTEFILNVTTDLDHIRTVCNTVPTEDSEIADDGWVLFATTLIGPDYYLTSTLGVIENTVSHFNNDLSWSCLHNRFWKHERQLIEGYMNGMLQTFYSAKKIKQQECSIILCDEFDPEEYITTELGETYFGGEKGYVRRAVLKPYGEINLTLEYGPQESGITPEPEIKTIYIYESYPAGDPASGTCGQLFAVLSEPADDNLVLIITVTIRDNMGAIVAVCPPDTWTIPLGAMADSFLLPFCGGGIPVGGCYETANDWTDAEGHGWEVTGIVRNVWIPNCPCL